MPMLRSAWVASGLLSLALAGTSRADDAPSVEKPFTDVFHVEPGEWSSSGTNPWFVLEPGFVLQFAGKEDGEDVQLVITVHAETKLLDGVETRVVEERETHGGVLVEVSLNYFALSKRSNDVYYFGEDVDVYKDGKPAGHGGSWHAGENGAKFGLMMPGTPLLGARHHQEVAPGVAMDRAEIVSLSEAVETPAGRFTDCVRVEESTPLEKGHPEYKSYARGIGLVRDGSLLLVKYEWVNRGGLRPALAPLEGPASSDPRAKTVLVYLGYSEDELRDPTHPVTVDMLLTIVAKDDVPREVREAAVQAITADRAIVFDPDLSLEGKREDRNRVKFSEKALALLTANDVYTRKLGKELLEPLWRGYRSASPAIRNCDPRDIQSCAEAAKAWKKIFTD